MDLDESADQEMDPNKTPWQNLVGTVVTEFHSAKSDCLKMDVYGNIYRKDSKYLTTKKSAKFA